MERLERIHELLFEMLVAIDELCEKHSITYFLDSGTLLGAVREKDFIPWDDDADISMKREDYEKFLAVANELPKPYRLVTPECYGGYFFDFTPRILNMDEPLREQIEMEFPVRFLCKDDCRGLCPKCGKNLNEGGCGCDTKEIDPRLEPLKKLLAKMKEEEGSSK